MQWACSVITLSRSASIDNWNDSPKQPIIVIGTNKYFTIGATITVNEKSVALHFFPTKIQLNSSNYYFIAYFGRRYLKTLPISSRDIGKLSGKIHSALRLVWDQLDYHQVHRVIVVDAPRSSNNSYETHNIVNVSDKISISIHFTMVNSIKYSSALEIRHKNSIIVMPANKSNNIVQIRPLQQQ